MRSTSTTWTRSRSSATSPLPLQVDGEDLGDVDAARFEAERDARLGVRRRRRPSASPDARGTGASGRARASADHRRRGRGGGRRGRGSRRRCAPRPLPRDGPAADLRRALASSTTGRAGSGRTRSSGATRRSRSARRSRSPTRTGSSRRYRESAIGLLRGMPPETVLAWWRGHPAGWWNPAEYRVASIAVPIATHVPHAVGLRVGREAARARSDCAIAYFGDGATSEGAFHEGANFAAVMRAPVVLLCNNNQWAISTPLSAQTRAESLADKAVGYGMPGVRVDGGDVLAVYEATARGARPGARRRRADLHRGAHLPRRAARDRRRPERLLGRGAGRGGEAQRVPRPLRALPAARAASSTTSWPRRSRPTRSRA